ncbi:4'-phosphopantetheinyl transferase family protein [Brevibacterium jeotgali]|uniref:4'-phosphopantetheinyl transferase EntD (Siderophore biosynthesis) n=1 Tax=Brevibacterium jeotgali TaxID=1262550 RepID=A0A2H1L138_9MICO|nr:4'-phosphopantetheinyl transferase superfamily protein [Brevibacterium jeotgali]TWC02100.1 4'-phosphopantetheinyl transferase EntD [Brevibacterium jeotgali]SMY10549.1 4'-phosphopantetheinyl transferase EntD (siderophore biosynthesis) [Brevibacterium jeotgali]
MEQNPLLRRLLPATVRVASTRADAPAEKLFADESAHIARAVAARRADFAAVRHCARAALAQLGIERGPMVPGERGAPPWPDGIVGSLTHAAGLRAAAVAHCTDIAALGIDAEAAAPLPDGVLGTIALPREQTALRRFDPLFGRVLFSAKEALYKTWFPLTRRWLDFEDAEVVIGSDGGFTARLLVKGPVVDGLRVQTFSGRWAVAEGIVATAIALPRR